MKLFTSFILTILALYLSSCSITSENDSSFSITGITITGSNKTTALSPVAFKNSKIISEVTQANVSVYLYKKGSEHVVIDSTQTDASGYFQFHVLEPGEFTIMADLNTILGGVTREISISNSVRQRNDIKISLTNYEFKAIDLEGKNVTSVKYFHRNLTSITGDYIVPALLGINQFITVVEPQNSGSLKRNVYAIVNIEASISVTLIEVQNVDASSSENTTSGMSSSSFFTINSSSRNAAMSSSVDSDIIFSSSTPVGNEFIPAIPKVNYQYSTIIQFDEESAKDANIVFNGSLENTQNTGRNDGELRVFVAGTYDKNTRMRTLIEFNTIPETIVTDNVSFAYMVLYRDQTWEKHFTNDYTIDAHKMLVPWKEGTSKAPDPSAWYTYGYDNSLYNGATGLEAQYGVHWSEEGVGLNNIDAETMPTSSVTIVKEHLLTFDSVAIILSGAVHDWVQNPSTNYGVLLRNTYDSGNDENYPTYPMFHSGESPIVAKRPKLVVVLKQPIEQNSSSETTVSSSDLLSSVEVLSSSELTSSTTDLSSSILLSSSSVISSSTELPSSSSILLPNDELSSVDQYNQVPLGLDYSNSIIIQPDNTTGKDSQIGIDSYIQRNDGEVQFLTVGKYDGSTRTRSLIEFTALSTPQIDSVPKFAYLVLYRRTTWSKHYEVDFKIDFHKLLKPWKEGSGEPSSVDLHFSTANDNSIADGVTGQEAFYNESWNEVGVGLNDIDAGSLPIAYGIVKENEMATFDSLAVNMTEAVKFWIENPSENYGFIMRHEDDLTLDISIPSYPSFYSCEIGLVDKRPKLVLVY
ncbi:MAG: DNRLRE domain-containing protein [Fibrobacterales bacterium]